MSNCLCRSLPTKVPIGHRRESTGRNESEPTCSVVRRYPDSGRDFESVEPLIYRRRLERFIAGQNIHLSVRRSGNQNQSQVPEDCGIGMGRLSGVARMACAESSWVKHGRSVRDLQSQWSNCSLGTERPAWKSERFVVVMTDGTTQPIESKGTALLQRVFKRQWPGKSSLEVSHA